MLSRISLKNRCTAGFCPELKSPYGKGNQGGIYDDVVNARLAIGAEQVYQYPNDYADKERERPALFSKGNAKR